MKKLTALSTTMAILLTACGPSETTPHTPTAPTAPTASSSAAAPKEAIARHDELGFSLAVPPDMQRRHDFRRSYLDHASWKSFAEPDSHGTPAAALVLKGSNKITAAELRVGVSSDEQAIAHCTDVPASGMASKQDTVTLHGTDFVHFHAGDAAMSHYLQVEGYRAVHAGRCYAIDLWINGTRPEVYDPPATPPFERDDAMRQLHDALAGFRFSN